MDAILGPIIFKIYIYRPSMHPNIIMLTYAANKPYAFYLHKKFLCEPHLHRPTPSQRICQDMEAENMQQSNRRNPLLRRRENTAGGRELYW